MGENTNPTQDYQSARADFDARWQAALSPPEPSEIRLGQTPTQDAMLDRMLTRIRDIASACAERGLMEPQGRDAIHGAVDVINGVFADVERKDLAELMRSTGTQLSAQAPHGPPNP